MCLLAQVGRTQDKHIVLKNNPSAGSFLDRETRIQLTNTANSVLNEYSQLIKVGFEYDGEMFLDLFDDGDIEIFNDLEIKPFKTTYSKFTYEEVLRDFKSTGTSVELSNAELIDIYEEGSHGYLVKITFTKHANYQLGIAGKPEYLKKPNIFPLDMLVYVPINDLDKGKIRSISLNREKPATKEEIQANKGRDFREGQFSVSAVLGYGAMTSNVIGDSKNGMGNQLSSNYNARVIQIAYRKELDQTHRWLLGFNGWVGFSSIETKIPDFNHEGTQQMYSNNDRIKTRLATPTNSGFANNNIDISDFQDIQSNIRINHLKNGRERINFYEVGFYTGISRRLFTNRYRHFQVELSLGGSYLIDRKTNNNRAFGEIEGRKLPNIGVYFPINEIDPAFLNNSAYNLNHGNDFPDGFHNITPLTKFAFGAKLSPTFQYLNGPIGFEVGLDLFTVVSPMFSETPLDDTKLFLVGNADSSRPSLLNDYYKPGLLFGAAARVGILFRMKKNNK